MNYLSVIIYLSKIVRDHKRRISEMKDRSVGLIQWATGEAQALILSKNLGVIIITVELSSMITEQQPLSAYFHTLNMPVCRNLAVTIVAYLSPEDIQAMEEAFRGHPHQHFLVEMVRNRSFINAYINAADKSLYFTFFQEQQYKKIEIQQIAAISHHQPRLFSKFQYAFSEVDTWMRTKVSPMADQMDLLREMVVNPDLPLPQMKRQTQGIYCTSPFQLFLVHATFSEEEEELFTTFEKLQEFLNIEQEQQYLKQFMLILKDKHKGGVDLKKVMKLRYTPYEIHGNNFKQFQLQNNQLHNFIVGLFAITDIMLEAVHEYVRLIADPLHRLVELTLRYNIYRNYVLAVEELLSFVFKMYDNIYHETIEECHDKPKYTFWRPAMTKWFLRMDPLHREGQEVYMHCLTKLRINKLKQQITEAYAQDQKKYGKLLEAIEMNNFQYDFSEKISRWGNGASELSLFFDDHLENYEIVVMQFNQYLVDISVNQQTVHWCGHSDHQLQAPYLNYQTQVVNMSLDFLKSLCGEQKLTSADVFEVIKIDADYISTMQIKNRTLKKILDSVCHEYKLEEQFQKNMEQLVIFKSFQEADKKLEYFNHKALILAVIDENARPFYSIPPHCSPQKLIDMIDTNDSENNNSDGDIQYLSGSEENKTVRRDLKAKYESDEEMESPHEQKGMKKGNPRSNRTFLMEEEQDAPLNVKTKSEPH